MGWFDADYRASARGGFLLPFLLVIGGFYILAIAEYSTKKMPVYEGVIEKYRQVGDNPIYIYIYIYGEKEPFIVRYGKDKQKLSNVLGKEKKVRFLTYSKSRHISEIEVDGVLIFKFNFFVDIKFGLIFILIGGSLIPAVIRIRKKNAKYFGDDKLFKD